jgi:ketosteroid isomerase-like protein
MRVVRDFVSSMNERRLDRVRSLCSADFSSKGMPFSGCGLDCDDTDGKHIYVKITIPGSPCAGKLLPGDEILSVSEGGRTCEGYKALRANFWGQGLPGTEVEFRIRRGGEELSVAVVRAVIASYQFTLSEFIQDLALFDRDWPDHHEEIMLMVDGSHYITVLSLVSGTNRTLSRPASWAMCVIYTLRNGKILETRRIDDSLSQVKQLGYMITPPGKVGAV